MMLLIYQLSLQASAFVSSPYHCIEKLKKHESRNNLENKVSIYCFKYVIMCTSLKRRQKEGI